MYLKFLHRCVTEWKSLSLTKDYAAKLMFDMDDSEYETLQEEFRTILKQMDLIENIPNIKDVQPMSFPFITYKRSAALIPCV